MKHSLITKVTSILWFAVYAAFLILIVANSYIDQIMEFVPNQLFVIFALSYIPLFMLLRNAKISRWHWYGAGIVLALSLCAFPSTSADPFRYLFNGELINRFHVSPYSVLPATAPADHFSIFIRDIWWSQFPSPYGPLWDFFMVLINALSANTLVGGIILLKILDGLFLFLCARFIYKYTKNISLTYLFVINPVILLNVLHTPHPDIAIAFLLLISLLEKLVFRSVWGIVLTSLIKIHSLAFAPFWLGTNKIFEKIKAFVIASVFSLLLLQLLVSFKYVDMIKAYTGGGAIVKTAYLLFPAPWMGFAVFVCLYAVVYVLFLKKKLSSIDAYIMTSFLIPILLLGTCYPWHFIVPLALLFLGRPHPAIILFISVATFLAPIRMGLFFAWAVAIGVAYAIYTLFPGFSKKQLTF